MWRGSAAAAAAAAIAAYAVYHHRRRRRASPSLPDGEATPDATDIGRVISYWFDGDFSELLSTRWFVQHNSGAQRALDTHIAAEVSLALGLELGPPRILTLSLALTSPVRPAAAACGAR